MYLKVQVKTQNFLLNIEEVLKITHLNITYLCL